MIEAHNIVSSIDWSKRFVIFGKPFYHIKINMYYNK